LRITVGKLRGVTQRLMVPVASEIGDILPTASFLPAAQTRLRRRSGRICGRRAEGRNVTALYAADVTRPTNLDL